MVFQSYAVWPHMTVFENVAYSLKIQGVSKQETKQRVYEALELVGLEDFANRGASLLSGGQMQRVALARSLVMRPDVLLLDEPLSNLDARLRDRLRIELREIQLQLGLTTVYVTHDQQEAFALADRIAPMQDGIIVQMEDPMAMYLQPASSSIAHFLGVSNVHPVTPTQGDYVLGSTDLAISPEVSAAPDASDLHACFRSEALKLSGTGNSGVNSWKGTVKVASFQGNSIRYAVDIHPQLTELDIVEPLASVEHFEPGDEVWVSIEAHNVQVLPENVTRPKIAAGVNS